MSPYHAGRKSCYLFALVVLSCGAIAQHKRSWSVQDSVAFEYLADTPAMNREAPYIQQANEAIVRSPNGKLVLFVTWKGNLEEDSAEVKMWVYSTADIVAALEREETKELKPVLLHVEKVASSEAQTHLKNLQWDESSTAVYFYNNVMSPPRTGQVNVTLRRLDIFSGTASDVCSAESFLNWLRFRGDVAIYSTFAPKKARPIRYPSDFLYKDIARANASVDRAEGATFSGTTASVRGATWRISEGALYIGSNGWISPGGRFALACTGFYGQGEDKSILLLDLVHRTKTHIASLKSASYLPSAVWAPNGNTVLVWGDMVSSEASNDDLMNAQGLRSYDTTSRSWTVVGNVRGDLRGVKLSPIASGELVSLRVDGKDEAQTYAFRDEKWQQIDATQDLPVEVGICNSVEFQLQQDKNRPLVIWATMGDRRIRLFDQRDSVKDLFWAHYEELSWIERDGRRGKGGLVCPPIKQGARYPVVIQGYGYHPELFLPDGPRIGTCNNAQALVSQGFVVIQMNTWSPDSAFTNNRQTGTDEGPQFVQRIQAIIDELKKRPYCDVTRVAVIGFSRTGYNALYAATHPPDLKFSAFILDDSWSGGYAGIMHAYGIIDPFDVLATSATSVYGGDFWSRRDFWLEHETSFNVDRIEAPVLFVNKANGKSMSRDDIRPELLYSIGPFRRLQRPFDVVLFPQGDHRLMRPFERMEMGQLVVDWLNFWVQGRENPDPARYSHIIRWRDIRAKWLQRQTEEAAVKTTIPAGGTSKS